MREEELKNCIARDFFEQYDCTQILGDIDFCVSSNPEFTPVRYFLWAEAKRGRKASLIDAFVQLILTIGRARTFEKYTPPEFLGAFDEEKIAFLSFSQIMEFFYMSDFNWNVTPSDHRTKEFKIVFDKVQNIILETSLQFDYKKNKKELLRFIHYNFTLKRSPSQLFPITKNNFVSIYLKWLEVVKPSIDINWEEAKRHHILDADFYLADILSRDNLSLKDKLFVLLKTDHYQLDRQLDAIGLETAKKAFFKDSQRAHRQFWNIYERPPREEYWEYIINRRDLLVPQDIREREGSFFTPRPWVELSQQYLADYLGENWQDEYFIWDCCAGTGNLLNGLTNKYNIWASTLTSADVDVMLDRIRNGANLLESHVFQFDFLNDDFRNLPQELRDITESPEKRKKLVIYINPPYAEGDSRKGEKRSGVANSLIAQKYDPEMGYAKRELYIQFLMRIYKEIPTCIIANFSKLKHLQSPSFKQFRSTFHLAPESLFIVPADTFDNVEGDFPIGFMIWDTGKPNTFISIDADVYEEQSELLPPKKISSYDSYKMINDWANSFIDKSTTFSLGTIIGVANDFQNQRTVRIEKPFKPWNHQFQWQITAENLIQSSIYLAVRLNIPAFWVNDKDQFLFPNIDWEEDEDFQNDCLVYTIFSRKNFIRSIDGINHWIPFTETEVDAKDRFQSHFMSDFLQGKNRFQREQSMISFDPEHHTKPLSFTPTAKHVLEAGCEIWRYYHNQKTANPNASFYDIREFFQGRDKDGKMNPYSEDEIYMKYLKHLAHMMGRLTMQIRPKIFEYGFLLE